MKWTPACENELALLDNKIQDCSQSIGEYTNALSDTEPASEGGLTDPLNKLDQDQSGSDTKLLNESDSEPLSAIDSFKNLSDNNELMEPNLPVTNVPNVQNQSTEASDQVQNVQSQSAETSDEV